MLARLSPQSDPGDRAGLRCARPAVHPERAASRLAPLCQLLWSENAFRVPRLKQTKGFPALHPSKNRLSFPAKKRPYRRAICAC